VDRYQCHGDSPTGDRHCHKDDTDAGGTLLRLAAIVLVGTIIRSFLVDDEQNPAVPQFSMSNRTESGSDGQPVLQLNWAYRF